MRDVAQRVAWWIAMGPLALQGGAWLVAREGGLYEAVFENESGVVELATALLLVPCAWLALRAARLGAARGWRVFPALLGVFALGCVFLMGEELSWGQHVFEWQSPAYFLEHNTQDETNLHNLSSFNKNLPKWVLVVAMGLGGIAVPLLRRRLDSQLHSVGGEALAWMLPTKVCLPVALIVVPLHVGTKVLGWNGIETDPAWGIDLRETTELYISIFFFVYTWSLHRRLRGSAALPDQYRQFKEMPTTPRLG